MKEKQHLAVGAMVAEWEAKITRLKAEIATLTSKLEGLTLLWEGDLRRISILERNLRESVGEIRRMRREADANVEREQGSNPNPDLGVVG